jgi:hypothetical protein
LSPGDCSGVAFSISVSDLSIWNVVSQSYELVVGNYTVLIGSSSRDIRQTSTLTISASN